MANTAGRLDLLVYGILERISSRDPVASALFQTFAPEILNMLKPLDIKPLRQAIRERASVERKQAPAPRKRSAATGGRGRKALADAQVTVIGPDGKSEIVKAEWVA